MARVKIVTFVPIKQADAVRTAMAAAGAGVQGNYSSTSFSSAGTGRFKPLEGAKPFVGTVGELEEVAEEKIEVICERSIAKNVIVAMKAAHPYEEVAFDIIPLLAEEEL
jgi:hypothetical protein